MAAHGEVAHSLIPMSIADSMLIHCASCLHHELSWPQDQGQRLDEEIAKTVGNVRAEVAERLEDI